MSYSDEAVRVRLQQIPLFASIKENEDSLVRLQGICKSKSVTRGQTVIKEGDVGSDMFVVYSGAVEIKKRTRAGDDYTVIVLRAEDNVFFGELALVDDDKRSATVVTREDSEFLVIEKQDFLQLGDNFPQIGLPITRALAKILASRLRKTTGDMLTIFDALVQELQA
ncbi:MAG TPA: cyclic nucleotide-binding domain-containing protein [Spirochaetia bacterium]|nr:cyclic nucleotide-binding domain-containing protein [Spirochaetia bacterium]